MYQIEAVFLDIAVAVVCIVAVIDVESEEVAAPFFLGVELEAFSGSEVTDCPELAFCFCAPVGIVKNGSHFDYAVGVPVPTAEF